MFNIGQRTAVEGAFRLAGYARPLRTAPIIDPTERAFLLDTADLERLRDHRALEQIVGQVLGCKVWIVERTSQWGEPIPFE